VDFRVAVASRMSAFRDRRGGRPRDWSEPTELRAALLDFIADFSEWENSTNPDFLETSRALTQAAHVALGGSPETRPLVLDPFAGGGAIPFEALRVGADSFASDLNPVAILLNKVLLEQIPEYGQRLADELRIRGAWVAEELRRRTAALYPAGEHGTPVAYLWARSIRCTGPACGADIPLLRSFILAKRVRTSVILRPVADPKTKRVTFVIDETASGRETSEGTVRRGAAVCPVCSFTTPVAAVRVQLTEQQGGATSAHLVCVVTRSKDGTKSYRLPTEEDHAALREAHTTMRMFQERGAVPDEILPLMSGVFNAPIYGMTKWALLFSSRQLVAICTLSEIITELRVRLESELREPGFAKALATCLFLARDKSIDFWTSLCGWIAVGEKIGHTFGRQALGMVWDFAEGVPIGNMSGSWDRSVEYFAEVVDHGARSTSTKGTASLNSATDIPLPDDCALALVTDPPYYNAVPYADLSDFFYVWLRRSCARDYPDLFAGGLSPKDAELCEMSGWDPVRYPHKNAAFYEAGMQRALAEGRRVLAPGGIAVIVFAHKTTEGWETLLNALIAAGWIVTASWPIDTERGARLRAMGSAALASSIHIVCRPREHLDGTINADEVGDWRDVLQQLPHRIHDWMPRLAEEGVVGADAIFACLGPALEIFSRYSKVERANGEAVLLSEYLEQVWAAVAREALSMIFAEADAAGLDEDARITAMWLWTIAAPLAAQTAAEDEFPGESTDDEGAVPKSSTTTGYTLEFDAARKIAQGLGARLESLQHVIEVRGDKARLLPVAERTRYLFGGSDGLPAPKKSSKKKPQRALFEELEQVAEQQGWGDVGTPRAGSTTLDRVHQAMILFGAGRGEALKRFLVEDGVGRSAQFWKVAQALSALYPAGTDEKRWVDGVLARKKGLGF
jgi:putative DNA methylase